MKKVSLIIPVYNVELYLKECLNSAVRQTLDDYEIICIDDGSTDHSGEILDSYALNHPNLKVIHQENRGLSGARNTGFEAAKGKYICFLDSDDFVEDSMLEELYQKAEKDNLEVLYFNTEAFYETDELQNEYKLYEDLYKRNGVYEGSRTGQELFTLMKNNKEFLCNMGIQFFEREFLVRNQVKFYEGILYEDFLYTFQCAMLAERAGYLDKILHHRRVREGSIVTSPKTISAVECHIYTYIESVKFVHQLKIEDNAKESVRAFLIDNFRRGRSSYRKLMNAKIEPCLESTDFFVNHYFDIIKYEAERLEQNKKLRARNRKQKSENENLRQQNENLQKQIEDLKNSKSYRIGRAFTFIPRKIKQLFR